MPGRFGTLFGPTPAQRAKKREQIRLRNQRYRIVKRFKTVNTFDRHPDDHSLQQADEFTPMDHEAHSHQEEVQFSPPEEQSPELQDREAPVEEDSTDARDPVQQSAQPKLHPVEQENEWVDVPSGQVPKVGIQVPKAGTKGARGIKLDSVSRFYFTSHTSMLSRFLTLTGVGQRQTFSVLCSAA